MGGGGYIIQLNTTSFDIKKTRPPSPRTLLEDLWNLADNIHIYSDQGWVLVPSNHLIFTLFQALYQSFIRDIYWRSLGGELMNCKTLENRRFRSILHKTHIHKSWKAPCNFTFVLHILLTFVVWNSDKGNIYTV